MHNISQMADLTSLHILAVWRTGSRGKEKTTEYKLVIEGRLNGQNEFIKANRTDYHKGNEMKQVNQNICIWNIIQQMGRIHIDKPVRIHYTHYEPNTKRDLDNIATFCMKVFQDALVLTKVLDNDGCKQIKGFTHDFYIDKDFPRIEIVIEEV